MRGNSKLAVALTSLVAIGVAVLMLPAAAGAGHGKHGGAKGVKALGTTQNTLLRRGLRVRLPKKHPKGMKVRATSTTFDDPTPSPLTKTGRARRHKRIVKLKLTTAGKAAVSSCEAREIQVRAGKRTATAALKRDTPACSPKPIDLSRAADCDFIGEQDRARSACSRSPTTTTRSTDPRRATGRRIDLQTAAMPANAGGIQIDAGALRPQRRLQPRRRRSSSRSPASTARRRWQQTGAVPINHIGRYARS